VAIEYIVDDAQLSFNIWFHHFNYFTCVGVEGMNDIYYTKHVALTEVASPVDGVAKAYCYGETTDTDAYVSVRATMPLGYMGGTVSIGSYGQEMKRRDTWYASVPAVSTYDQSLSYTEIKRVLYTHVGTSNNLWMRVAMYGGTWSQASNRVCARRNNDIFLNDISSQSTCGTVRRRTLADAELLAYFATRWVHANIQDVTFLLIGAGINLYTSVQDDTSDGDSLAVAAAVASTTSILSMYIKDADGNYPVIDKYFWIDWRKWQYIDLAFTSLLFGVENTWVGALYRYTTEGDTETALGPVALPRANDDEGGGTMITTPMTRGYTAKFRVTANGDKVGVVEENA